MGKADIIKLINNLIGPVYYIGQGRDRNQDSFDITQYFKLTEKDVFLNDEVEDFIRSHSGCFNHSFVVFDSDLIGYENNEAVYIL